MLSCFGSVQLFATLWTVACQAPLSVGFSRQEYRNRLPCPPPVGSSLEGTQVCGIEPTSLMSPSLAGGLFTTTITWEALKEYSDIQKLHKGEIETIELGARKWLSLQFTLLQHTALFWHAKCTPTLLPGISCFFCLKLSQSPLGFFPHFWSFCSNVKFSDRLSFKPYLKSQVLPHRG